MLSTKPSVSGYRCPGELYSITPAIHLARLAAAYPACADCPHRFDHGVGPLTVVPPPARRGARLGADHLTSEGLAGVAINQIDAVRVRQFALAVGATLRDEAAFDGELPAVAVGPDGRWLSAQLVAAASEGLQLAGCRVVELTATTSGCLAASVIEQRLAGGLLVGNADSEAHTVGLKVWGPRGEPWSLPGRLDRVSALWRRGPVRPVRRGGGLDRYAQQQTYLAGLREHFHGLRPLGWVLDTTSQPLMDYLAELTSQGGCRVLMSSAVPMSVANKHECPTVDQNYRQRRVERLRGQVVALKADFGFWVDGDGETCQLIDELGRPVSSERLALVLVAPLLQVADQAAEPTVVLEENSDAQAARCLTDCKARVVFAAPTREAMFAAMRRCRALMGAGPSGRLWFGADSPMSDALQTLSALLVLLSQSDRPLSVVLDQPGRVAAECERRDCGWP